MGATLVTEQLAFKQTCGNSHEIHFHKWALDRSLREWLLQPVLKLKSCTKIFAEYTALARVVCSFVEVFGEQMTKDPMQSEEI